MEKRPDFETLTSYEEFKKYYWYRKELSGICRKLGIEYRGTKQELNHHMEEYFCGKLAERKDVPRLSKKVSDIELHTPLLDCGFSFNAFFREYFAKQTGTRPFKFTADMAAAWRKVKVEEDRSFTMQDMLDVYWGKSDYAKYDASVCEWNRFVKDFFRDKRNTGFRYPLRMAAALWQAVKESDLPKVYSSDLRERYKMLLAKKEKSFSNFKTSKENKGHE